MKTILLSREHPWKSVSENDNFWLHGHNDDNFHIIVLHLVFQTQWGKLLYLP